MNKQHTLRSEALALEALAPKAQTMFVGKHFATPAPKRVVKTKPSILVRIFKKG
jgi:predicted lipoprotein with Yx(FWY)xxD motif